MSWEFWAGRFSPPLFLPRCFITRRSRSCKIRRNKWICHRVDKLEACAAATLKYCYIGHSPAFVCACMYTYVCAYGNYQARFPNFFFIFSFFFINVTKSHYLIILSCVNNEYIKSYSLIICSYEKMKVPTLNLYILYF